MALFLKKTLILFPYSLRSDNERLISTARVKFQFFAFENVTDNVNLNRTR
jgi:hypothetical protein